MILRNPLWDREWRSWLNSPAHYVMGAAFLFLTGVAFWANLLTVPGRGLLTSEVTFGGLMFWMAVLAMASICAVRPLGEEYERGTMELLMTAPVGEVEILLAKFGTTLSWVFLLCLPAVSYPWLLRMVTDAPAGMDLGAWAAGLLILLLVAGTVTAAGLLVSQWVRRQVPAAMITFAVCGMVVFRGAIRSWLGTGSEGFAAVGSHVSVFATGMVDSRALVFHVSVISVLLFLNIRSLQLARCRRAATVANVAAAVVLTLVLALLVNYVAMRHGAKWDWSSDGRGLLSGRTVEVLQGLRAAGKITLVAREADSYVPGARRLLRQYGREQPLLQVAHVDPDVEIGRTRDLVNRYGIRSSGAILLEFGNRHEVLYLTAFAEKGSVGRRVYSRGGAFLGALEQGITSAIHVLSRERVPVVYFLRGHGERRPDDFADYSGYSEIAGMIRDSPADVRSLVLDSPSGVAGDCSLLVIAGPSTLLSAWEIARVRDYLAGGGRLLLLLDAGVPSGLEPLLEEWGVRTGAGFVVEPRGGVVVPLEKRRAATGTGEVLLASYGQHPVGKGLSTLVTTVTLPRVIEAQSDAGTPGRIGDQIDRPRVISVALTSGRSWLESDMEQQPPQFNEGYDRRGPLSVAVAVEKAGRSGIKMDIRPVRMVVIGDSQFGANRCLAGGNRLLFMNAVDWLLEREREEREFVPGAGLFDIKLAASERWPAFLATAVWWPFVFLLMAAMVKVVRRDRRVQERRGA